MYHKSISLNLFILLICVAGGVIISLFFTILIVIRKRKLRFSKEVLQDSHKTYEDLELKDIENNYESLEFKNNQINHKNGR